MAKPITARSECEVLNWNRMYKYNMHIPEELEKNSVGHKLADDLG